MKNSVYRLRTGWVIAKLVMWAKISASRESMLERPAKVCAVGSSFVVGQVWRVECCI